ncbi:hypothetical protein C2E23DRAFT_888412 [Lenzites betulinus]|nr:hypothetical protein C2E23DRAFT_888412 [Lenzites betulinus]
MDPNGAAATGINNEGCEAKSDGVILEHIARLPQNPSGPSNGVLSQIKDQADANTTVEEITTIDEDPPLQTQSEATGSDESKKVKEDIGRKQGNEHINQNVGDEGEGLEEDDGDDGDEGEEDDASEDKAQDEDILAPSDIKGELAGILGGDLEFAGTFSFNKTYPTAPNPALNIDGLGTIGLPLSTRDAAAIKSCSEQAPFGKVDQTIVDTSVRDTWEIDAAKVVHFANDSWELFMQQTVRDVCEVLGVNFAASKPRAELYKLLLYETGSHFLPHVDTEKVNGMFATIVVVLPSKFTGGTVHVKHGDLHSEYDSSGGSLTNTSVLAWYTDVEHEVKAITSGYRLALSFNLIHTTDALRPAMNASSLPFQLQHVLRSWSRADDRSDAPHKIIHLLGHKYSLAALSGSALKGVDAHLVAILEDIGKRYGIRLGLANLVCTERGSAQDNGNHGRRRHGCGWCDSSSDFDDDHDDYDVDMEEVDETNVDIDHLVDLDGRLIRNRIDCDLETEVIPEELVEEITAEAFDDEEYEGYQGNYAGSLERIYRRTVLVMWPAWAHLDIISGSEGIAYACQKLRESNSPLPTTEETELTEVILIRAGVEHSASVVNSVCLAAIRWKDLTLWFRAVKACDAERSVRTIGEEHLFLAIYSFGFSDVKPCLEHVFEQDPSSVSVLQFLENFETSVTSRNSEQLTDATKHWVVEQRTKRLNALNKVEKDEYKTLTSLAFKYGGVQYFENNVLPLIKSTADSAALLEYVTSLHSDESIPAEARLRTAKDLMVAAIAKFDFYATPPEANPSNYSYAYVKPTAEPGQVERAKAYIKASLELGCDDVFPAAVDKLLAFSGQPSETVIRRVKNVLTPLVTYAQEICHTALGGLSPSALSRLSTSTSSLYVQATLASPQSLLVAEVPHLVQALIASSQPGTPVTENIRKLEGLDWDSTVLRAIIQELVDKRQEIDSTRVTLDPILLRLLKTYVNAITLQRDRYWSAQTAPKPAIDALEFCLALGLPDACNVVIGRILNPPKLDDHYIKEQLAPLVPDIRAVLIKYKQPLTSEPFATVFRKTILYWVLKVMGSRPPDVSASLLANLKAWMCKCNICVGVRAFLNEKSAEIRSWERIGAPSRKHVEIYLSRYARQIATYDTIRSSPQGITVVKTKAIMGPAKWAHAQAEGQKLLKSIASDDDELRAILGAEAYPQIIAGLAGHPAATARSTTNAPVTSAAGTRTNAPIASGSSAVAPRAAAAVAPPAPPPAQPIAPPMTHNNPRLPVATPVTLPHAPGGVPAAASAAVAGPPQNFQAFYATQAPAAAALSGTQPAAHVAQAGPSSAGQGSASIQSAGATGAKRPDDADHGQRKRRKMAYSEEDVIDLT